jgi:hypothetical protein
MQPAIAEIELVQELLAQSQCTESGDVAIDESLVEIIEFGLADPSAIVKHELIQMGAVPAREGRVNRPGEFSEAVRPRRSEYPSGPRPVVSTETADQIHPNRQPRSRHD